MTQTYDIARQVEQVQALLSAKFGIRPAALPVMVRRAGRRLPRLIRARAQELCDAQAQAANPKLARQLDQTQTMRAFNEVTTFLGGIDVADRRRGVILGLAGAVASNLLLVFAGFVLWMWWRGYL